MTQKGIETSVGIFILLGLVAIIWLVLKVGNWSPNSSSTYEVTAYFDNVAGLSVKAPVTLAGVKIGHVASIGIDSEDYSARVVLHILDSYNNLPVDSGAAILTSGLLGAQYVGIDPGAEETYLVHGGQIDITQSAMVLENLIGQILIRTAEGTNQ
ncbi:MAG: outer membrane lipid asymmetry maintenance protein MlaD [Acidiferrobacteraceae bacterium]|nr:outer membrane lipid asymmetry maintenance protein MlaD [Acidiferrobacteraceae bacterium]|tara:strand:- start:3796 stop:4260 length:465 start_codon:yes stop_codon:yes gene_type:complete